jgi:hypothetical protein
MKSLQHAALTVLFIMVAVLPLKSWGSADSSESSDGTKWLLISASVGPLHYLSGARVVVKNRLGKRVGHAVTNTRGIALVTLSSEDVIQLPLKIITNGGRIFDPDSDALKGTRFSGHLQGEVSELASKGNTLSYLDLITTTATRLQSKNISYTESLVKIRAALGIASMVPAYVVRYQNNRVDWPGLDTAIKKQKGYDRLTRALARKIRQGKPFPDFVSTTIAVNSSRNAKNPPWKPVDDGVIAQASSDCNAGNNKGSGGSSTENIVDYGVDAIQALLALAGKKSLADGVGMIAGMVMTGSSSNDVDKLTGQLEQVSAQLACISEQITYLTQQMGDLLLATSTTNASACANKIDAQYQSYQSWIEKAADGTVKLDSSNTAFKYDLDQWGSLNECGASINSSLFETAGGRISAWQQINKNYQYDYKWYSQKQAQELQEFLAWWAMELHNSFVLVTEFNNYYGAYQDANYFVRAENFAGSNKIEGTDN